jgi:hypothetical protein
VHVKSLETYLKTATQGLWGKRKLEVREELEAHVLERARKHELLGLTRADAISKTLEELGNARAISYKMTEVHTMPKLLRSMLIAMFAFFAFVTSTTNPAGADRLKPSFELQCTDTDGRQSAFEFRPSRYWKKLNDLEMARAIKPVMKNLGHWGNRMQRFENQIGANLTLFIGNSKITGNLRRPKSQPTITCKSHKIGDTQSLREFRKMLPDIMRDYKRSRLPKK